MPKSLGEKDGLFDVKARHSALDHISLLQTRNASVEAGYNVVIHRLLIVFNGKLMVNYRGPHFRQTTQGLLKYKHRHFQT